ncbi:hypothetical protein CR513_61502, partial [Mucuna pruriens]
MTNHSIKAKIIYEKNIGYLTYIFQMSMSSSQSLLPFKLIRRSYTMTINKNQELKSLIHGNERRTFNTISNVMFNE